MVRTYPEVLFKVLQTYAKDEAVAETDAYLVSYSQGTAHVSNTIPQKSCCLNPCDAQGFTMSTCGRVSVS